MEMTFKLKGLNCPNCAKKIELDIQKVDFVLSAQIDLMRQELNVEVNASVKDSRVLDTFRQIVHRYEPEVEVVVDYDSEASEEEEASPWRMRRLIVGGIAALLFIILTYIPNVPTWLEHVTIAGLLLSYGILGGDILFRAVKNISHGQIFDENFLMALATIGALAIGEYPEAVAVMLFYQIGEMFQDRAVDKSRRSIQALMDIRPDMARVLRNGEMLELPPEKVGIGEIIVVKPGERVPLDGIVSSGDTMLDMRALTGESVPKRVRSGDEVLSGSVNTTQVFNIRVSRNYAESTASKIIDLVQKAGSRKAKAEHFITVFARYYTPVVVVGAVCLTLIPVLFFEGLWTEWLNRSFVFLVISCPCALVISVPLTFFGGLGAASKCGILIKGGNYLEALNQLGTLVFDKTGTLTRGTFRVTQIVSAPGKEESEVLKTAMFAEKMSNHPIAKSILAFGVERGIELPEFSKSVVYTELSGKGVKVEEDGRVIYAGNEKLMTEVGINFMPLEEFGTLVYVAEDTVYLGCIRISDDIKEGCKEVIESLRARGIEKFVMLTGDTESVAKKVAQSIGLDDYCANMLPSDKVSKFEAISSMNSSKKTAFVGDGVNDAPVLARADIGIAMGGIGADAAIESADIVFMDDDLAKMPQAMDIAKRTKQIVMQNIVFAIGVKIAFLVLGAIGLVGMWAAVFADVGVMIIAVFNAMRMLKTHSTAKAMR